MRTSQLEAATRKRASLLTLSPPVRLATIVGAFFLLGLVRLAIPGSYLFDEKFYVPAAARLVLGIDVINREHPMLGKEIIAVFIALFGNGTAVWRIGPLICATGGLWCMARAVGLHSRSPATETAFAALLASGFYLFVIGRLAILDGMMFGFVALGVLLFVSGRLLACGVAMGLAVACKWTAAPVLLVMVLAQLRPTPTRAVAMGAVAVAVYFATFLPALFLDTPIPIADWPALHWAMIARHSVTARDVPALSQWWEWVLNVAPIWMFHGQSDGAFRIVLLGGNPATMLLIPLAIGWALARRIHAAYAPALMWAALLAFWALATKPAQFSFHYLLPSTFGLAVVAIVLGRWWNAGRRWPAIAVLAASLAAFAWFFPALTAAPDSRESRYDWLPGWQVTPTMPAEYDPARVTQWERREACLYFPQDCWSEGNAGEERAHRRWLELRKQR